MDAEEIPTRRFIPLRAPRMTDAEVVEAMLDAGVQLIEEEGGLTVSMHHLSYETVIQRAGVPRSSAYRIWSHKGLFNAELLLRISRPQWLREAQFPAISPGFIAGLLEERQAELADPTTRARAAEYITRQMREAGAAEIGGPHWKTYLNSRAALSSLPDGPERDSILNALDEMERAFIDDMARLYDALMPAIGSQFRSPFTAQHMALQGATWYEGLAMRRHTGRSAFDGRERIVLDTGDGPEEWTLTSVALAAGAAMMTEPDPSYEPQRTADLIQVLRGMEAQLVAGGAATGAGPSRPADAT